MWLLKGYSQLSVQEEFCGAGDLIWASNTQSLCTNPLNILSEGSQIQRKHFTLLDLIKRVVPSLIFFESSQ